MSTVFPIQARFQLEWQTQIKQLKHCNANQNENLIQPLLFDAFEIDLHGTRRVMYGLTWSLNLHEVWIKVDNDLT